MTTCDPPGWPVTATVYPPGTTACMVSCRGCGRQCSGSVFSYDGQDYWCPTCWRREQTIDWAKFSPIYNAARPTGKCEVHDCYLEERRLAICPKCEKELLAGDPDA